MKLLVTGFRGFVSPHFLHFLNTAEPGSEVLGIDRNEPEFDLKAYPNLRISFKQADLLNRELVNDILLSFRPGFVLHLASVSSVAQSWQTPLDSYVNNTNIFLNLVEQVRMNNIPCRILSVGSSEEYGQVNESDTPLTESYPLHPVSPYAVARVSQELLSKMYADGFNQDIIMTRSFNHIGPGQRDSFVIASFAKQLVNLSKHKSGSNTIVTGDLSVIRDFLDVRDVVRAYYLLLKKGKKGDVYNVCSGRGTVLRDMIFKMSELLQLQITLETDPSRIRPNENKKMTGSYQKLKDTLGWEPEIAMETTLADIIAYWQQPLC